MGTHRGFTLLELLACVALVGLVLGIGTPAALETIIKWQVIAETKTLRRALSEARLTAIEANTPVILCPIRAEGRCTRDWSADIFIFSDKNRNRRVDIDDTVLRQFPASSRYSQISFAAFGPGYLRFRRNGLAADNGSFTLCPPDKDIKKARQIVLNRMGRAYISRDGDGDGVVEYGNNKEPSCP